MSDSLLFISDLHLQQQRPELTEALLALLEREAGRHRALYILGDLFEVWLGDDAIDELGLTVAQALRRFAQHSDLFLMHGNRDFLLGGDFATRCGATLLDEPHRLTTALGDILLLHGDTLCLDDVDYQRFRQQVRDPEWQRQFLAMPIDKRIEFATAARAQSKEATASKQQQIMDVNSAAVERCLDESAVQRLLHGHTHRPAIHDLPAKSADGLPRQRIVLGDWEDYGWFCTIDQQIHLQRFAIADGARERR